MAKSLTAALLATFALTGSAVAADFMAQSERIQGRSYSEAVVTRGGRTVWLAGQTTTTDLSGNDISRDFEAQTRTVFALIDATLKRAGGSLRDVTTMTVFLLDPRNAETFAAIRTEMFPDRRFPASAQITVSRLADPAMQIEIQAVAVIDDLCAPSAPCLPR